MKVCVIDIGTNSIHSIFADIHSTHSFQVIGRQKSMVCLGEGAMMTGELNKKNMKAALEALEEVSYLAKSRKMDRVIAVSTSAVRETKNGGDFLEQIKKRLGIRVKVITGKEEARLIFLAVKNTINLNELNTITMDIGGGSTEFIYAVQNDVQWMKSVKLGSNRLSQIFPLSDPPKKSEIQKLEKYILEHLDPILSKLSEQPIDAIIGTSGTLNNLSKMIFEQYFSEDDIGSLRQKLIGHKKVLDIYNNLIGTTTNERKKIKGLDKNRADMIIQGVAIPIVLIEHTKIKNFISCDTALREGILYDLIEKHQKRLKIEEHNPNIRKRSIIYLLERFKGAKQHAYQTAKLAQQLFDELQPLHNLDPSDKEILEYAALVHNIGFSINFKRHHKHTYYLITNAELSGFDPIEIKIIAWIARLHRLSVNSNTVNSSQLEDSLIKRIKKLAAILRIADGLDHSHFALIESLKAKILKDKVSITVYAEDYAQWEIYEAKKRAGLFCKIFKTEIDFKIKQTSK